MLSYRLRRAGPGFHVLLFAGLMAALMALSGCQVRPLYGEHSGPARSIGISEAHTRVGLLVRNELIFAFGQGAGEPINPVYTLDLRTIARTEGALPSGGQDEFTAARVVVTGDYRLVESATGEVLATGSRSATALLDLPGQGYARLRAIRDAEDRAAREAAMLLRADISAKLAQPGR